MKKIVCLMLSLFCIFNSAMPIEAIERNERVSIDALQPNQISLNDPSIEGFVVRLYRFALGRNADTKGFTEWTTSLRMKRKSASEVAKSFFLSNEFTQKKIDNIEFVNLLYKTLMNRTGDASGKVFWVKQLQIGESRAYVINQFTKSNEFQNLCAKYGIEAGKAEIVSSIGNTQIRYFVDRLYNICLNRNADLAGLNHWTSRLAQGIHTGALTVRSFFLSQEFISRNLSNHDFLKIAYQAILNRSGDASGLAYWNKMLEDGYTRDYVVAGFVKSNEFTKLCAAYGITRGSYVPDLQLVRKDDRKICVDGNGKQLTGFQRIDGKKYYFDPANGGKYHLGWLILPGSGRFYFTEDGSAKIEGQMELFGSVGRFDAEGRFIEYEEAASALNQAGWILRLAFNWVVSNFTYDQLMTQDINLGSRYFANAGFTNHKGNCYAFAGAFYQMAKILGYDAKQIAGYAVYADGHLGPHSWVEINEDGQTYIYDPEMAHTKKYDAYHIIHKKDFWYKVSDQKSIMRD